MIIDDVQVRCKVPVVKLVPLGTDEQETQQISSARGIPPTSAESSKLPRFAVRTPEASAGFGVELNCPVCLPTKSTTTRSKLAASPLEQPSSHNFEFLVMLLLADEQSRKRPQYHVKPSPSQVLTVPAEQDYQRISVKGRNDTQTVSTVPITRADSFGHHSHHPESHSSIPQ
ncbi:hypothetical protein EJ06DRAFT_526272 [Trichodelitschia bisporula]|uniref:Uncharacterized protein n=1 Tax=Trichodelitschia bisporula TaxID=703511 RepID=A0A6G1I815_9PEZI|nr:hypothetical protein EJ06DRAFT_526272 [Trichodelitschia bisporula]